MANEKLLRLPKVSEMTGLGKSTIWRWIKNGKFPKQVKLSNTISVWKLSEVQTWIDTQLKGD